ncbi:MAG: M18 family aminopeptidase [Porticoccaceae bacterium]|nr:M18 family aminopeptidase [Porticoccaceae bacterium]
MTSQASRKEVNQQPTQEFNQQLLEFIERSPTPFHATQNIASMLEDAGFEQLAEGDEWSLNEGGRYYLTRNDSSIIAFIQGVSTNTASSSLDVGIRMVGAHTDSPTLMVKPQPEKIKDYFQLGVEVYGGALLNPWFDRDLSIAGRVVYRDKQSNSLNKRLINFQRPVATIPSLAIHLDREANKNRTVNPQTDIPPILFEAGSDECKDFRTLLARQLLSEHDDLKDTPDIEVFDYELCFYDTQAPAQIGLNNDFIASARLDNLLSCFCGLQALLKVCADSQTPQTCMLVCTDHEEVGSASACGAQGPMLQTTLERMLPDGQARARAISRSLMISADNAHGVHPNYASKHDGNHVPVLNRGPVLKINANQRYATTSVTAALFRQWCELQAVPLQSFVTRTDLGCGSTIGPITATQIGVPTLDVGVPTFAMHSIRELAGSQDGYDLSRVMTACFNHQGPIGIA